MFTMATKLQFRQLSMILDKQKINKYSKQYYRNHSSNPSIFSYKSRALRAGFIPDQRQTYIVYIELIDFKVNLFNNTHNKFTSRRIQIKNHNKNK